MSAGDRQAMNQDMANAGVSRKHLGTTGRCRRASQPAGEIHDVCRLGVDRSSGRQEPAPCRGQFCRRRDRKEVPSVQTQTIARSPRTCGNGWTKRNSRLEPTSSPFRTIRISRVVSCSTWWTATVAPLRRNTRGHEFAGSRREMTQVKGTSEVPSRVVPERRIRRVRNPSQTARPARRRPRTKPTMRRSALMRGLEIEQQTGVNPYKFGMIGASDSHTGLSSWKSRISSASWPQTRYPHQNRYRPPTPVIFPAWEMSAGGIAGVWATANTRDAIMAAFQTEGSLCDNRASDFAARFWRILLCG
jgi:hypothetical protein